MIENIDFNESYDAKMPNNKNALRRKIYDLWVISIASSANKMSSTQYYLIITIIVQSLVDSLWDQVI